MDLPAAEEALTTKAVAAIETDVEKIKANIDLAFRSWYEGHFHKQTVKGLAPLASDDKDALQRLVTLAVTKPKE
jgi:hypothetical protein